MDTRWTLLPLLLIGCSHPAPASSPPIVASSAAPTADGLRQTIAELSSDAMAGRGPSTPADHAARAYLIDRLQQLGYAPGGPGGAWEQPFDVVGVQAAMPATWSFRRPGKPALSFAWWDEYIGASGVQTDAAAITNAEVVFVGYGIQAPEMGWDDFKGKDLRGKVLLMLNNDPASDPALFGGTTRLYYGRWTYKYESAARQGAAGAIIIHTTPSAGYPWQVVQTSWSQRQFELPAAGEPRVQVRAWLTEDAARRLVALSGKDLTALIEQAQHTEFAPVPLGITTSLAITNDVQRGSTANVLGILRGSDPAVADQAVVISAHHDHLGVGKPDAAGDTIYNGALDNAAGCAQVLEIAKAIKALPTPPRRSILILFPAAEEQGLLGSAYYAAHPTFAPGKLAADLNYDGGNIWGRTRDVTYIGKGKTTLDPIVDRMAARQHRIVKGDQFPDRGFFYRSDQLSFARIGVPGFYPTSGTESVEHPAGWQRAQLEAYEHEHYHQPSDELKPTWNLGGMVEDAQLGFWVATEIANAPQLPGWVPGDEFEAARQAATIKR